ncbi:putative shugoshin [Lupinus albus]|uniref:Putative shugoshin n=1 Tax=Lupinus albus TaxID=3870 RepID=A0A6A4NKA3_LUPAL|nr:putative shugoshin [Lupinus albus]
MEGEESKRGKTVIRDSVGISHTKMLNDITNNINQQQRCQKSPLNQQPKQKTVSLSANAGVSTDQILKENAMLMQLLANRNAVIESCKVELQKSQTKFQKLQKQNSELALTNSRMLAELNSSRQRLRELQHELGIKNGILKAMKLELMAKEHQDKLKHEIDANEVGATQRKQPDEDVKGGNNPCHTKRKRVSKSQSFAPAVKHVKPTGKVDNQRYSLRRQSKAEKPSPSEDFFEVDEIRYDVIPPQECLANEIEQTSLPSKVHEEARENSESSGATNSEQVRAKKNIEKKRPSFRRQSARFKPENLEPTEDSFEVDDAKYTISHLCDDISEKSGPTESSLTSGQQNKACKSDPWEIRRSSVGRPMRQSVVKIQSYKEVPLNVKMRRPA